MKEIYIKRKVKDDSIKLDFADVMQKIMNLRLNNINDEFINDIIDCIRKSHCGSFILDKRIKDIKDEKDDLLLYITVDDYKILMHRDVEKDFMHLQKVHEEKAKEKIKKTPNHPNNDYPRDSEKLKGDLKGWFSQRISKKDRLVYKKDIDERIVYIAAVCGHYDDAPKRTKTTKAYREM